MPAFDPARYLITDTSADARAATPLAPLSPEAATEWLQTADPAQARWAKLHAFTGARGEVLLLPAADSGADSGDSATGAAGVALMGLNADGDAGQGDPWLWAGAADALPPGLYALPDGMDAGSAALAALGWALAQYRFDRYRREATPAAPKRLAAPETAVREAIADAAAVGLVRDLVNTPAADMGPAALADAAQSLAAAFDAEVTVITGDELLTQGFPAIHAVGRAADDAPRLIDLVWGRADAPKLTLVGKGVCFDSGGLNLKPGSGMRLMKKDMGGAAHVLGLAHRIMAAGADLRLRVLIPAVENAISGNAFRPGDILSTRKGLSVEIGNTDAEGRLVLADALTLADEESPDLLLDFATLTGAARVALGGDLPALFTPDHDLAARFARAAEATGDPLWRLPLWQPYAEELRTPVADIANVSESGFAGSITAALFLSRFVSPETRWAHFDVYAWNRAARPGRPQGGEAQALRSAWRTLTDLFSLN